MRKVISSLQHPYIKHLVHLRQNGNYRQEYRSVVVEGLKMIKELEASQAIKTLISCNESLIPAHLQETDTILVEPGIMKKISGVVNPEGLLAEVQMPAFSTLQQAKAIVALDRINDPGNLGALLRTALAFGWDGVYLIGECCDPYNDKALRAARGATFRLALCQGDVKDFMNFATQKEIVPWVADIDGKKMTCCEKSQPGILVLGNEAHGPAEELLNCCQKITLPMSGAMESLNVAVAGGILMYLLRH